MNQNNIIKTNTKFELKNDYPLSNFEAMTCIEICRL